MIPGFIKQRCPKCGGNMYLDKDCYLDGDFTSWYSYQHCLQCGYIRYSENLVAMAEEMVRSTVPAKRVVQYV